jgi:hypothetical protein
MPIAPRIEVGNRVTCLFHDGEYKVIAQKLGRTVAPVTTRRVKRNILLRAGGAVILFGFQ